jgi:hypothetical protein
MRKNLQPQPDAPESNAGDDFHLLWAARRALLLLHPRTDLKGFRLEGPPPEEMVQVDAIGDKLLGIDLAEYFGGTRFEEASKVVYSQLKYSTRRPNEAWTAARLAQGKRKKHSGSIIHRLAQVYKAYADTFGRESVLAKLSIQVVSNRPCEEDLAKILARAQSRLGNHPEQVRSADLFDVSEEGDVKRLTALLKGSMVLNSREFTDFLRVLDLSRCGEQSRLDQDIALVREIGGLGFTETSRQYSELKSAIARRMMPESRLAGIMTADDIAPIFGIPRVSDLFPAPPHFEQLDAPVERTQIAEIAKVIISAKQKPVCVHGGAGTGKTTLVRSIAKHLTRGSVVVLFDCYGGGSYLDRSKARHGYPRAITEIANELAAETGVQLLLNRQQPPEDLLHELRRRLELASHVVRAHDPEALVVVVVDAADNSVIGAAGWGEESFVRGLATCQLPDGCRLVFAARSSRVDTLRLPSDKVLCEIAPFTPKETEANIRHRITDAQDQQIAEFHRLSNGIPRVQGYALSNSGSSMAEALALLRPGGKTLDGLIDAQITEAARRIGVAGFAERICPALLALPRPVPLEYIALLAKEDTHAVADFCADLRPGLTLEDGVVSFRDEDFENRLRQRFSPTNADFESLANVLMGKSDSDKYAASHLADVLKLAGRRDEIVQLVYREKQPTVVVDPVERAEVFARRARLALAVVLENGDRTELLRLLLVVAEAAKTDHAVETLLLRNSDLACRYGDPATVQRLYVSEKNDRVKWYVPTHLLCAANFARNKETHDRAREHLRAGNAWIRHWSRMPDDERQQWSISVDDIALGTEAALRLSGYPGADRWLRRWRPPSVVLEATQKMVHTLVAAEGNGVFELLEGRRVRADALLAIIDAAMNSGLVPPRPLVDRAVRVWRRIGRARPKLAPSLLRAGVSLCEAAASCVDSTAQLTELLGMFSPSVPEHRGSFYSEEDTRVCDTWLRAKGLMSAVNSENLSGDDVSLLPSRLQKEPDEKDPAAKQRWEEDRKEFQALYGFLVPAYLLRAQILCGKVKPRALPDLLKTAISAGGWEWSSGLRLGEPGATKLKALVLADAVVRSGPDPKEGYETVHKHFCKDGQMDLAVALAEKAAQVQPLHGTALEILDGVLLQIKANPLPASRLVDLFVKCSRIAGRVDGELGRRYFEQAVEAASEIDEEAFNLLELLSALAERASADDPAINEVSVATDFAAVIEDCHWRLEGYEGFPWSQCIAGLTRISPKVAATAIGRWDQRGILAFAHSANGLVKTGISKGILSPVTAIAWSVLSSPRSDAAMEVGLDGLTALKGDNSKNGGVLSDAVSILVDHAVRLAPLQDRKGLAEQVLEWAEANGMSGHPAILDLKQFLDFIKSLDEPKAEHSTEPTPPTAPGAKDADVARLMTMDWDKLLGSCAFRETPEIEGALRTLDDLIKKEDPPWPQKAALPRELLARIRACVSPSDFCRHLDALLAVNPELLTLEDLIEALKDRLTSWDYHQLVREWKGHLPGLIAKYRFHDFFWSEGFALYKLDELERSLGVAKAQMFEAIVRILPEHLREVSAKSVYVLARGLVASLPAGAALKLLGSAIPEYKAHVKRDGLACRDMDVSHVPDAGSGLAAAVLWFLFGHPDKRVRWTAVHAARRMVRLGDSEIIVALSKWLEGGRGHPFVMPGTTFYWLGARQWFFLLVDKLSQELPETVLPISALIAQEAVKPPTPHALIMRLAKGAALRLAKHAKQPYNSQQVRKIASSLVPLRKKAKTRQNHETYWHDDFRRASGRRFQFDSTDTLPYWYSPAGNVFGVDGNGFCKAAERWICDEWGFSSGVWHNDPVRKWQVSDHDWTLRSNNHGSDPTIEDLRLYLEFNAMSCVMAELVATRPVAKDRWEREPWENWLSRWDLEWPSKWLADLRQETPRDPYLWRWSKSHSGELAKVPDDADFDHAIGLLEPLHLGYLVADAREHRYQYDDSESIDVTSALVSSESSQSLLHALAECQHHSDYRVPTEGDELQISKRLPDGTRFVFQGWTRGLGSDSEGLDRHDPLRYGFGQALIVPGKAISQWASMALDSTRCKSYRKGRPRLPVTIFEHWNDCPRERYAREFQTEGHRLWVNRDDLLGFLRSGHWDLLVECVINRQLKRYGHGNQEEQYDPKARLYLVHADGTVETAEGRSRLRTPPGSRVDSR